MSVAGCEFGDLVSIALGVEECHRAFGEVAAVAGLPFVVDVGEDGADEADDGGFVGEDPHDAGSAFHFFVEPLERVRRPHLLPVRPGEGGEGEDLGLGVVHQRADLGEPCGELVADLVPGGGDGVGVGLGEDRAEHRGDHVLMGLGHEGEQVAGEVDAAALMGGALEERRRAATSPACWSEITSRTPPSPRALRERRKPRQNTSSSESPMSTPRTSRSPSAVIPVAITTAIEVTWAVALRTWR